MADDEYMLHMQRRIFAVDDMVMMPTTSAHHISPRQRLCLFFYRQSRTPPSSADCATTAGQSSNGPADTTTPHNTASTLGSILFQPIAGDGATRVPVCPRSASLIEDARAIPRGGGHPSRSAVWHAGRGDHAPHGRGGRQQRVVYRAARVPRGPTDGRRPARFFLQKNGPTPPPSAPSPTDPVRRATSPITTAPPRTSLRGEEGSATPGHFGRIQLPHPVVNPLFVGLVVTVMQTVCFNCHRLRLSPYYINTMLPPPSRATGLRMLQRLKAVASLCNRQQRCQFCGAELLSIKQQGISIVARPASQASSTSAGVIVSANTILALLTQLPDVDIQALGFVGPSNHPCPPGKNKK